MSLWTRPRLSLLAFGLGLAVAASACGRWAAPDGSDRGSATATGATHSVYKTSDPAVVRLLTETPPPTPLVLFEHYFGVELVEFQTPPRTSPDSGARQ